MLPIFSHSLKRRVLPTAHGFISALPKNLAYRLRESFKICIFRDTNENNVERKVCFEPAKNAFLIGFYVTSFSNKIKWKRNTHWNSFVSLRFLPRALFNTNLWISISLCSFSALGNCSSANTSALAFILSSDQQATNANCFRMNEQTAKNGADKTTKRFGSVCVCVHRALCRVQMKIVHTD